MQIKSVLFVMVVALVFSACKKDQDETTPSNLDAQLAQTIEDVSGGVGKRCLHVAIVY